MKFRDLRADEIDVRVAQVKLPSEGNEGGVSLLLYKDARVDQNILDETVGSMNWQRHHSRDNANCTVSIWDDLKKQWIEKEDTGTESNTEAEKGLASDSFKRACFNWGIGRELYTAPFIWIKGSQCNIRTRQTRDGKDVGVCNDYFYVTGLVIEDKKIKQLVIVNKNKGNQVVFSMGLVPEKNEEKPAEVKPAGINAIDKKELELLIEKSEYTLEHILKQAQIKSLDELTPKVAEGLKKALQRSVIKKAREAQNGPERETA